MVDNTADTVQHLEEHEFFERLLMALRKHAGREAPVGTEVTFEAEAADLDPARLRIIAHAHRKACTDTAGSGTGREAVATVMAALATHIALVDLIDDPELRQLYIAILSDSLAARNRHFIEWHDSQSFPPALNQACNSGAQWPLNDWYCEHMEPLPGVRLFAVIIGAMTDGEEMKIKAVRSRATAIKFVLERHGYDVHAPCTGPPSGRDPAVVVQDDVDKIARADIVIALLDPAAHGVGILLGEAARSHPAVIFVAEACTDITPLAAIIGDPDPTRVTYITDASMATEVEAALVRRRDALQDSGARRRSKAENSTMTFEEYSQAYQFALNNGLALEVPEHPEYRVKLICTSITSFRAGTQSELEDICTALNDLLYGPDQFAEPAEATPPASTTEADGSSHVQGPIADNDQVGIDDNEHDDELDLDELIDEWDQPSLFDDFTRHTEVRAADLPKGWRKVNPLTLNELAYAETSRAFLVLNDREFNRMVHEARVVRYREALAGAGVSRAHFGDAQAWITFWKVHLGRP